MVEETPFYQKVKNVFTAKKITMSDKLQEYIIQEVQEQILDAAKLHHDRCHLHSSSCIMYPKCDDIPYSDYCKIFYPFLETYFKEIEPNFKYNPKTHIVKWR